MTVINVAVFLCQIEEIIADVPLEDGLFESRKLVRDQEGKNSKNPPVVTKEKLTARSYIRSRLQPCHMLDR